MKLGFALLVLSALAGCLAGCIPYHYTDNPAVSGRVVDARTARPLSMAAAHFESSAPRALPTRTTADGSFSLPAEEHWGLLFLIATPSLRKEPSLVVQAPGYASKNVPLGWSESPVRLDKPVALQLARYSGFQND